jgi:hypothetical protein
LDISDSLCCPEERGEALASPGANAQPSFFGGFGAGGQAASLRYIKASWDLVFAQP